MESSISISKRRSEEARPTMSALATTAAAGVPSVGWSCARRAGSMRSCAIAATAREVVHMSVHSTATSESTAPAWLGLGSGLGLGLGLG